MVFLTAAPELVAAANGNPIGAVTAELGGQGGRLFGVKGGNGS